jgi:ribonuclease Z
MQKKTLLAMTTFLVATAVLSIPQKAFRTKTATSAPDAGNKRSDFAQAASASQEQPTVRTEIVFLGTGTPRPLADRQGPSLAVISNGKAYLVDTGLGLTRQANSAFTNGVRALKVEGLSIAFITHLHSDHTLGLPDLILTPWVFGRAVPLELYGPPGIRAMADNILKAYERDQHIRIEGLEQANTTGNKVNAHEMKPGVVYQDANVKVTAFLVDHGDWPDAYGFRFDTADKSIVISGDARPSESVIKACSGCDVLIHEVYSGYGGNALKPPEALMKYMAAYHTSAQELGALATKARAKTLIVTHYLPVGSTDQTEMVAAIKQGFSQDVIVARDLDVIVP